VSHDEVEPPDGQNLGGESGGVEPALLPSDGIGIMTAEASPGGRTLIATSSASRRFAATNGRAHGPQRSIQGPLLGVRIAGTANDEIQASKAEGLGWHEDGVDRWRHPGRRHEIKVVETDLAAWNISTSIDDGGSHRKLVEH
jgi:hypothetical protein